MGRLTDKELGIYIENQLVEILKMSFKAHREALTLTHDLWIQVISKAALQIRFAFFPPTTCISNIFLLGRTALAPSEPAAEEAGMWVKEWKEQQTDESTVSHSGSGRSASCFLPRVHKIPLSANLGSSIKRLEIFKYQKFCLEVKFQSFDCIWSVCIGKKCHGKGQPIYS